MDLLWKDIRFSIQSLRANPGFAIVAILTLALGIGATTAIFSVVNGVLLQPLPLKDPEQLVMVWEQRLNEPGAEPNVVAPRNYIAWLPQTGHLFSSLAASFDWELNLTGQSDPEVVRAGLVTGNLFPTLGAKPYLGRYLEEKDATATAGNVMVLSHAFWQRKFGANPKAIGRSVQLDGSSYTIVGVMPREFFVPTSRADLWVAYIVPNAAGGRYLTGMARLKPGITPERAKAEMILIAQRMAVADPARQTHWSATVIPMHEQVVGNVRRVLMIVFAAVALLLLIGCVNIANLLLSRATGRRREMAVRAALGASRGRLIGQLLTESVILSVVAGILGVIIAGWATMLFVRLTPQSAMLPRMNEIAVNGSVLAMTALITLATGILFGLAPAIEASRTDLQTGLKSSGRGSSQDRRGKAFRNTLVVAEVALATVLLIGAGLLIKSFAKLEAVQPGVRPENVLTMRIVLPFARGDELEKRRAMLTRILDEIRRVPGVQHAGAIISRNMPFTGSLSNTDFAIEGQPPARPGEEPASHIRPIAGDYFQAMGMTLLSGRMLGRDAGTTGGATEFVVNEQFARMYFHGKNPLGRRLLLEWDEDMSGPIVGVVGNVRTEGLDTEPAPAMYFSYLQDINVQFTLTIATAGDPWAIQKPVTQLLRKIDPRIPISDVSTLEDLVFGTIARPRFNATMLTLFAALGLLLASIGIYGVLSYSVAQRTQEMGIRMALGADPRDVLRLVVKDGLLVAVIGVVTGVVIALAATRVLASLLYGVTTSDPTVFGTVAATLTAVALVASYIPARRATRVDPMVALRAE